MNCTLVALLGQLNLINYDSNEIQTKRSSISLNKYFKILKSEEMSCSYLK